MTRAKLKFGNTVLPPYLTDSFLTIF